MYHDLSFRAVSLAVWLVPGLFFEIYFYQFVMSMLKLSSVKFVDMTSPG